MTSRRFYTPLISHPIQPMPCVLHCSQPSSTMPKLLFCMPLRMSINMMDIFSRLREMDMLLIDDDEWIRDSLSIYFDSEDCRIVTCESAEDGLQALDRQRFDIIIADYRLPGMDGIEFFEKSRLTHPDVVKILITAYPTDTVSCQAIQAGVQKVIPKPFTSRILMESLSLLTESAVSPCEQKPPSKIQEKTSAKGGCHAGKKLDE